MKIALGLILPYFIGAVPFALIVGKLVSGKDVRDFGSGNLGGTNAIRVLGWKAGLPVIIADIIKGSIATWLGWVIIGSQFGAMLAGLIAALGHCYTIFANFKGGKGVAVGTGIYLVLVPKACLVAFGIFVLTVLVFKYVSLASINAAITIAFLTWYYQIDKIIIIITFILAAFVIYRHRANIVRILNGKENKVKI